MLLKQFLLGSHASDLKPRASSPHGPTCDLSGMRELLKSPAIRSVFLLGSCLRLMSVEFIQESLPLRLVGFRGGVAAPDKLVN